MTDQDEPVTARQVDAIGRKLDDVIVAVDRNAEAMRLKFFTARRAIVLAAATAIVGFVVNLGLFLLILHWVSDYRHQQAQGAVVACLNTNASRAALERRFEQSGGLFLQSLSAVTPPAVTADEAKRRADLIAQATDRYTEELRGSIPVELQARDCSERAATQPTLVEKR